MELSQIRQAIIYKEDKGDRIGSPTSSSCSSRGTHYILELVVVATAVSALCVIVCSNTGRQCFHTHTRTPASSNFISQPPRRTSWSIWSSQPRRVALFWLFRPGGWLHADARLLLSSCSTLGTVGVTAVRLFQATPVSPTALTLPPSLPIVPLSSEIRPDCRGYEQKSCF